MEEDLMEKCMKIKLKIFLLVKEQTEEKKIVKNTAYKKGHKVNNKFLFSKISHQVI